MDHARSDGDARIGELAADLGLNPKTIRFYEETGPLALLALAGGLGPALLGGHDFRREPEPEPAASGGAT